MDALAIKQFENTAPLRNSLSSLLENLILSHAHLDRSPEYQEFPIHAFPNALSEAAKHVAYEKQVPIAGVANAMLSCMSLAYQPLIRVITPTDETSVCSLYCFTVIEAAGGKTTTHNAIYKTVIEAEQFQRDLWQDAVRKNKSHLNLLVRRARKIEKDAERLDLHDPARTAVVAMHEEISSEIENLKRPRPQIVYNDVSAAAFARNFGNPLPTAAIVADEGSIATNSSIFSRTGILNKAWEGLGIDVERFNSSSEPKAGTLTLGLMIQPAPFFEFIKKQTGTLDNGFLGRCLICFPPTLVGRRQSRRAQSQSDALDVFHAKMKSSIHLVLAPEWRPGSERIIEYSAEATHLFFHWFSIIENHLGDGKYFDRLRANASRGIEQISRIAALFANFEEKKIITPDNFLQAATIVLWFLGEYDRVVNFKMTEESLDKDAETIRKFLLVYAKKKGTSFLRSDIKQFITSIELRRDSSRFERALTKVLTEGEFMDLPRGTPHPERERTGLFNHALIVHIGVLNQQYWGNGSYAAPMGTPIVFANNHNIATAPDAGQFFRSDVQQADQLPPPVLPDGEIQDAQARLRSEKQAQLDELEQVHKQLAATVEEADQFAEEHAGSIAALRKVSDTMVARYHLKETEDEIKVLRDKISRM